MGACHKKYHEGILASQDKKISMRLSIKRGLRLVGVVTLYLDSKQLSQLEFIKTMRECQVCASRKLHTYG
jgi:hypothetical protein